MNSLRSFMVTLSKAAIVTIAVVIGFGVGSELGMPVWLQGFFLIPAMLLFYWLIGQKRPALWKMIGYTSLLSAYVLLASLVAKFFPDIDYWYFLIFILIAPFESILNWFERWSSNAEHKQDEPSNIV